MQIRLQQNVFVMSVSLPSSLVSVFTCFRTVTLPEM
jgi:hypothetical protein